MASVASKHEHKENSEEIFNEMSKFLDTSLIMLIEALEKHDVQYRLDSGTLLGAYRNGKALTKDSDHDIAITIEELMSDRGKAFLREFAPNFKRSARNTSSTVDKSNIEVFIDAETLLERIESGNPFVMANLGWEALFDGKPYKYKSHTRRIEHKIDVFILFPWNCVLNAIAAPHALNHYVYSLPFFGEHFARVPNYQVESSALVKAAYTTFDNVIEKEFPAYANIEEYLISIYGDDWATPSTSYHWHGRRKYLSSKIFTSELLSDSVKTTLDIQQTYLFDPTLLNN